MRNNTFEKKCLSFWVFLVYSFVTWLCLLPQIARSRNKWKFHLKDGIMNLRGRDYVFQKATGEAEW